MPSLPACRVVPLPDHQTAVVINGRERLRWHFGDQYPRPFIYPLVAASGESLVRMGHPGAPNHDHHRGVWFAHHKVLGIDFWSDQTDARIRQLDWLSYQDGDDEAQLAVRLGWFDGHDPQPLLHQQVVMSVREAPQGGTRLEVQATFEPLAEMLEFGRTNFGFFAVRVARSISVYFGGGLLQSDSGKQGERALFEQPARWVDYSGPLAPGAIDHDPRWEGITYFDHPQNPGHPAHWHVREDGWMNAGACLQSALTTTRAQPLRLRYLLDAHPGAYDPERAAAAADWFSKLAPLEVVSSPAPHRAYEIRRQDA